MLYKLVFLPTALSNILEIETGLSEFSETAADTLTEEIRRLTDTLSSQPYLYQEFEDDVYFRSMPLPYKYRLFYHVDEETMTIKIHRVIHGARDIYKALQNPNK
jgi:plasmid stabilization system protein ParE